MAGPTRTEEGRAVRADKPTVHRPLRVVRHGPAGQVVLVVGHGSPERDWSFRKAPLRATLPGTGRG